MDSRPQTPLHQIHIKGPIDPHTKAIDPRDTWCFNNIDECYNLPLFYCSTQHNHVLGKHPVILGDINKVCNYSLYKWNDKTTKEGEYHDVYNLTVKRIYWLQIPNIISPRANYKNKYWITSLDGVPQISPNRTFESINNNSHFSLKTKSIAHQMINLEFFHGRQCLHLNKISHIAHCQRCFPVCKTGCSKCLSPSTCKCACHVPTTKYSNPYHTFFCPALTEMWVNILDLCTSCSIIFPNSEHQFKWALISSDLHPHEKQDQRFLWFEIYSTYLPIIKKTHYFPEYNPTSYSNLFKTAFKHRIHTAYKSYIHKKNVVLASRSKNSKSKAKALTKQFLKTWSHPAMCSLDDDDIISMNVFENNAQDKP